MYLGAQTCNIVIGNRYQLRGLHQVEIKKSVHTVIQTAKLELPLSVVIRNNDKLQRIQLVELVKEGDRISIAFGYNGSNRVEFEGYVRRCNYASPFVLECEDEYYLLRKLLLKKSFKSITLKDLMQWLLDEVNKVQSTGWVLHDKMPEFSFSNFIINNGNGVDLLNELINKYGLACFLLNMDGKKIMYAGLRYGVIGSDHIYSLNRNTINVGDLKYNNAEPRRYKVTVKNFNKDGTNSTLETGDKDGEAKTVYSYGNNNAETMRLLAQKEVERNNTNGYRGSFDAFLPEHCGPGDIAVIRDGQFAARSGRHYVGTVTTSFGIGGGKRKIEIDFKTA